MLGVLSHTSLLRVGVCSSKDGSSDGLLNITVMSRCLALIISSLVR